MHYAKPVRLQLQTLDNRITPATFRYQGIDRTLFVTAAEGDTITVTQIPNRPTGYLAVSDGTNTFRTTATLPNRAAIVRNLIVRFDQAANGALEVDASTRLGGNLTVFGATQVQSVVSAGTYGGGLFFQGTGTASDDIQLTPATQVGGRVQLQLGDGNNVARIQGGNIGGGMRITGLAGNDTVNLLAGGDLRVNRALDINLGDGNNLVQAVADNPSDPVNMLDIGGNFNYQGGIGTDRILFRAVDAAAGTPHDAFLRVGGNTALRLDTNPAPNAENDVELSRVLVGGRLVVAGGGGVDTVQMAGPLTVGDDLEISLRDGANYFDSNVLALNNRNRIGGNFIYSGGSGQDQAYLDGTTVGNNVAVKLGNWDGVNVIANGFPDGNHQFFMLGTYRPVTVYGKVSVRSGPIVRNLQNVPGDEGADVVRLHRAFIGGGIDIRLGNGDDRVSLNDLDVSGLTTIDLGDGNNRITLDTFANDSGGDLTGRLMFGGLVTVKGGAGNDRIVCGSAQANSHVVFGDTVAFQGADGDDTLTLGDDVKFLVRGNRSTCETSPPVGQLNP